MCITNIRSLNRSSITCLKHHFRKIKSYCHICLGWKKMLEILPKAWLLTDWDINITLFCLVIWSCPSPRVPLLKSYQRGDQPFCLHVIPYLSFFLWYLSTSEVSDWKLEIMHHHTHGCRSSISCTAGSVGYLSAVNCILSETHADRIIPNCQLLHYPIHMT